jgi:hypothetical protein
MRQVTVYYVFMNARNAGKLTPARHRVKCIEKHPSRCRVDCEGLSRPARWPLLRQRIARDRIMWGVTSALFQQVNS